MFISGHSVKLLVSDMAMSFFYQKENLSSVVGRQHNNSCDISTIVATKFYTAVSSTKQIDTLRITLAGSVYPISSRCWDKLDINHKSEILDFADCACRSILEKPPVS